MGGLMLQISEAQFEAFNDIAEEKLQARFVAAFAQGWPDAATHKGLDELVHQGRERAAMLRLMDDAEVAVMVGLTGAAAGFDKAEAAQYQANVEPHLEREGLSGSARLAFLERALSRNAEKSDLAPRLLDLIQHMRAAFSAGAT